MTTTEGLQDRLTQTRTPADSRRDDDRGRRAREQLVRDHLPLVHYNVSEIAARVPLSVSRADLVSAGMLGLVQAAKSFDPERGVPFDRYATRRIAGALLDELRSLDWAGRSVRAGAREMRDAVEHFTDTKGRAPSTDEIAAEMGVDERAVRKLETDVHRATVLNLDLLIESGAPEASGADHSPSPEEVLLHREKTSYLNDAVAALPERLRRIVVASFYEDQPLTELAAEMGVSESRISQLRSEALRLLKAGLQTQLEPEQVAPEPLPNGRAARTRTAYYDAVAQGSSYAERLTESPTTS
jgi:RNA polymerase sigma factor for flagellar operon FliA